MLLRSSSTPVLGSILSSLPDHNNTNHHHETTVNARHPPLSHNNQLSVHASPGSSHRANAPVTRFLEHNGFRRIQSEGNLMKGLDGESCHEDFCSSPEPHRKLRGKHTRSQSTLSFTFTNDGIDSEMGPDEHCSISDRGNVETAMPRNDSFGFSVGDNHMPLGNCMHHEVESFGEGRGGLQLDMGGHQDLILAIALGLGDQYPSGSGGRYMDLAHSQGGGDGVEEHYRKMVGNDPSNALLLRNDAQFLYQYKNLVRAEEYYARAFLADPRDGEVLTQYGSLSSYFERAVQASPQDSYVHAAYASFLWEAEEEEEEDERLEFGLTPQRAAAFRVMASA